ncbi:hypothetical protein KAR34_00220, partial [bacterium]|nr:hypothetical protein [bacterium]
MTIKHFCAIVVLAGVLGLFSGSASALELIVNGDFLTPTPGPSGGIPGWITNGNPASFNPFIHTAIQHDATSGPIVVAPGNSLGGYTSSWIQQTVHIPRDALGSTLTFYYEWYAKSVFGSYLYMDAHFQGVELVREQGDGSFVQFDPTPGWTLVEKYVELSSYSDQNVLLRFRAYDDPTDDPSYIHVDDIS